MKGLGEDTAVEVGGMVGVVGMAAVGGEAVFDKDPVRRRRRIGKER